MVQPVASVPQFVSIARIFCDRVMLHSGMVPDQIIDRNQSMYGEKPPHGLPEPYLQRWFVGRKMVKPNGVPSFVENIYVHLYGRGDPEDMHDHPWDNVSFVVSGGYLEEYMAGTSLVRAFRGPGDIVMRSAEDRHRIVDVEAGTVTLFGTLAKHRDWGFWRGTDFVPWEQYVA